MRIKSLVKPFVAPAHRHLVIEDFPLKVCQTERTSNLLSGEAFVRAASALFCPSLLILFLHNGLPESTSSGWRMDEDEDVDGMDAGERALRQGQSWAEEAVDLDFSPICLFFICWQLPFLSRRSFLWTKKLCGRCKPWGKLH